MRRPSPFSRLAALALLLSHVPGARAGEVCPAGADERRASDAGAFFDQSGSPAVDAVCAGEGAAAAPVRTDPRRDHEILLAHSKRRVAYPWVPSFVSRVPSFATVEGPTINEESFTERLWRIPASIVLGPIGGAIDEAGQWSLHPQDGGDHLGAVVGAAIGGIFGFFSGLIVGLAGVGANMALAAVDLAQGKITPGDAEAALDQAQLRDP